jgi:hypothetical protein
MNKNFECNIVGIKKVVEEKSDKEEAEYTVITLETQNGKITVKEEGTGDGYVIGDKITVRIMRAQKTISEATEDEKE